jgi:hypothetical protein
MENSKLCMICIICIICIALFTFSLRSGLICVDLCLRGISFFDSPNHRLRLADSPFKTLGRASCKAMARRVVLRTLEPTKKAWENFEKTHVLALRKLCLHATLQVSDSACFCESLRVSVSAVSFGETWAIVSSCLAKYSLRTSRNAS